MKIKIHILPLLLLIAFALFILSILSSMVEGSEVKDEQPDVFYVDRMENLERVAQNELGQRNSTYKSAPSTAHFTKGPHYGHEGGGLKITYVKKNGLETYERIGPDGAMEEYMKPGKFGQGGWCGFYTLVNKGRVGKDWIYRDLSAYNYLTFWVRGLEGGENFKVGFAGILEAQMDDSLKSGAITEYLPEGVVTKAWQQAKIPLNTIMVDFGQMHAVSICFESDVFPDGSGEGAIYIDDIAFEK